MRNLMKLLAVAAILTLVSGMAVAKTLQPLTKDIVVKDSYIGMDRGLLDCSGQIELVEGVTVFGDNTGATNNVSTYSCSTWNESGGEVVYHIFFATEVEWSAVVNWGGCDLDLAVLDMCDEDLGCIGVANGSVDGTGPGWIGDVYFVVDGYAGAACTFDLTVTSTPYVPPVGGGFCALVEDVTGNAGMYYGDTCDGQNLVESLGCEAYAEAGLEDYYGIMMPPGCIFTAEVTNTADGALWVVDACDLGVCLAYADATFTGGMEIISYTNTSGSDMMVYLIIDSWGADSCGTYDMNFITDCAVANESMSFGAVKTLYK